MTTRDLLIAMIITTGVTGCGGDTDAERVQPYSGISEGETVRFAGNEPFWRGEVTGNSLIYATPDNPTGITVSVNSFAGNGGLSFSGQFAGEDFDLAITPGECEDTMADRTYPFTATLSFGTETRYGCAWTDRQPYRGDPRA